MARASGFPWPSTSRWRPPEQARSGAPSRPAGTARRPLCFAGSEGITRGAFRSGEQPDMKIAVPPDVVRKLIALGCDVAIEKGAGAGASYTDAAYKAAGATVAADVKAACKDADVVLKVQGPDAEGKQAPELAAMKPGAVLVA